LFPQVIAVVSHGAVGGGGGAVVVPGVVVVLGVVVVVFDCVVDCSTGACAVVEVVVEPTVVEFVVVGVVSVVVGAVVLDSVVVVGGVVVVDEVGSVVLGSVAVVGIVVLSVLVVGSAPALGPATARPATRPSSSAADRADNSVRVLFTAIPSSTRRTDRWLGGDCGSPPRGRLPALPPAARARVA
jgi:hypothetical protein